MGRNSALAEEMQDLNRDLEKLKVEFSMVKKIVQDHQKHLEILYENVANETIMTKTIKDLVAQDSFGEPLNDELVEYSNEELRENLLLNVSKV